ncbi:LuxR C-terminal-related transcriptional regulator [Nocardioides sp. KR10-350]
MRALEVGYDVASVRTVGGLVDRTLSVLAEALGVDVVSFNRMDLVQRTATVSFRPYRPEHEAGIDGVSRLLDEHPLFRWYTSQRDWRPVRISDVVPWREFRETTLFREVLGPIGAWHTIVILLTTTATPEWVYFAMNRSDRDFTDDELAFCVALQPAVVALYRSLSLADDRHRSGEPHDVVLTPREQKVLEYLAGGLTADAIARRLRASPATVRKHLQHLYGKLGTSDRLVAVLRGRDLGLLRAEDLTQEFVWNVHSDMPRPGPTSEGPE